MEIMRAKKTARIFRCKAQILGEKLWDMLPRYFRKEVWMTNAPPINS
jgi:hypothetical protein